jgi:hypothetical protein
VRSGCLPERTSQIVRRLGSDPGRFVFACAVARKRASDFVALFLLFRDSFSILARRIFHSLRKSFHKTGVFYQTDDKQMRCYHTFGCVSGVSPNGGQFHCRSGIS